MAVRINSYKHKMTKAQIRANKNNLRGPFHESKKLFRSAINYTKPLTYDDWMNLDPEYKAAALYVQFYDTILLAWYKVKSFYTNSEDGVETVLQYLMKNVPIIEKDPKRFTPAYIYRVAYNCLYCICHDIKRDKERFEKEVSNIQYNSNNEEFDLFDTVVDTSTTDEQYAEYIASIKFWNTVDNLGDDVVAYVECILSNKKLPIKLQKQSDAIMEILRTSLAPYMEYFM